jgi:hypothetical protein
MHECCQTALQEVVCAATAGISIPSLFLAIVESCLRQVDSQRSRKTAPEVIASPVDCANSQQPLSSLSPAGLAKLPYATSRTDEMAQEETWEPCADAMWHLDEGSTSGTETGSDHSFRDDIAQHLCPGVVSVALPGVEDWDAGPGSWWLLGQPEARLNNTPCTDRGTGPCDFKVAPEVIRIVGEKNGAMDLDFEGDGSFGRHAMTAVSIL